MTGGDWIKMRTDLYRDPKVIMMADILMDRSGPLARFVNQNMQRDMTVTRNVTRNVTVGALVSVWGVARHRGRRDGDDLRIDNSALGVVDDIADVPGFGEAMVAVGWLVEDAQSLVFPRFFAQHNVDPDEEKKAKARERQRKHRAEKLSRDCHVTVTPRVEKSREEKNRRKDTPCSPPEFDEFVRRWNAIDGVASIRKLTASRRDKLRTRLGEPGWPWREALDKLPLPGDPGDWQPDFDWLVDNDTNAVKIAEGKYDWRANKNGRKQHGPYTLDPDE